MADDSSDNPAGGRTGRSSLVERAAKRIVVDKPRPPVETAEAEVGASSAPLEIIAARHLPSQAVDRAAREVSSEEQPQLDDPASPAAGAARRRSPVVKIDIASLTSRNLLTPQSKRNRTVEEYRLIKRRVLSSRRWGEGDSYSNTIMVTSALPEEGKTTIAINLAMSIAAEEDLRVLLVDADFIKPDALRRLGVTASKGLIDVIQDPSMDVSDVMLATNIDKLSLIPSGQLHDRCTELLASARMSEIIGELASRYDDRILIFDSPPVLATTESVTLASHMGQVLFVVQAERTGRQLVTSALELIGSQKQVGLVLNRAPQRFGSTEFGAYYGSYYYGADSRRDDPKPTAG